MVGWWFCDRALLRYSVSYRKRQKEGLYLNRNGSRGFVTTYGRDICRNGFAAVCLVTISRLGR